MTAPALADRPDPVLTDRPAPVPADRPAPERGELTIAPQVVEKIAITAAGEVEHVGGAARRVLNVALGDDAKAERPRVEAQVDGTVAVLTVVCSVAYPAPVAAVTARLRAHLSARVEELTGIDARRVDITVAALTPPATRRTGRVQ